MAIFAPPAHTVSGGSSGGYTIDNSLRFDGTDDYLSRTFGTPTDSTKFTLSLWCKRGKLGSSQGVFQAGNTNYLQFTASDTLQLVISNVTQLTTTAVFRDPTAHYHIVITYDNAASPKWNLKVNNSSVGTSTATNSTWNTATAHGIALNPSGGGYLDGYLSDIYFIDGQALSPTDFGETNADGVWVPKAYTITGGTNSFHLDFADGTSTTTLGYDAAGSNDWTLNGMTRAAGVSECWMTDTPTNNFCGGQVLVKSSVTSYTNGNLTWTGTSGAAGGICAATMAVSSGKWYWEMVVNSGSTLNVMTIGILPTNKFNEALSGANTELSNHYTTTNAYSYCSNSAKNTPSLWQSAYGNASTYTTNDVVGVALDLTNGAIWFSKNGVWIDGNGTDSSATIKAEIESGTTTSAAATSISGEYAPAMGAYNNYNATFCGGQGALSSGATYYSAAGGTFKYEPPTGFKALSTANLPTVSITNPREHFDIIGSRTGTAGTYNSNTTKALLFQPDMVWIKSRGRAVDHAIYDSVRGVQKRLESNNTDAEVTGDTTGLTAFNSDGYSGGALDQINGTTATNNFVDWFWRAGGEPTTDNVAGAGNTPTAGSVKIDGVNLGSALAGTIAATRLSANTTAGFSIVTYSGNSSAGATVAHGLGVAPKMVITMMRTGGAENHAVWHTGLTSGTYYINLNQTAAQVNDNARFYAAPTSTVLTFGGNSQVCASGYTYVALVFAEIPGFSKAFSVTGNLSTDGWYAHLGFRPRWVLLKNASIVADWLLIDAARDTYNVMSGSIYADLSNAESTATARLDFTANGIKCRDGNTLINGNGNTIIGMAFAEYPFGGSNVAPSPAR